MEQKPLFITTLEEALHASGSKAVGYKRLCCAIVPELADYPDEAQKVVARKLNKKAKEVFSDKDMDRAIAHELKHGCHILKWFKDELQGYEQSIPKESKSELVRRLERAARLAAELAENQARIEELEKARVSDFTGPAAV